MMPPDWVPLAQVMAAMHGPGREPLLQWLRGVIAEYGVYWWDDCFDRPEPFTSTMPRNLRARWLVGRVINFEADTTSHPGDTQHPLDASAGEDDPFQEYGWPGDKLPAALLWTRPAP